jgi:organic hydroperoxide reductase OsmC/OhrA
MHPLPHVYRVQARAGTEGPVRIDTPGSPTLETAPPPQFDGPGGCWSPETLLAAAVADCYTLAFRAVARASRLAWVSIEVGVEAELDRADGIMRFTRIVIAPRLCVERTVAERAARIVLEKAARSCLVSNSLLAECVLQPEVVVGCDAVA